MENKRNTKKQSFNVDKLKTMVNDMYELRKGMKFASKEEEDCNLSALLAYETVLYMIERVEKNNK